MEMLSNGYGCIKQFSKTIKQSLCDWILPKFYKFMSKTMSDIPTASTSTASTSSESPASSSRMCHDHPYRDTFRSIIKDLDLSLSSDSEESEISYDSEESETADEESTSSDEDEHIAEESDENLDHESWSSTSSSAASCEDKSSSENSETEKPVLRERLSDEKSITNDDKIDESTTTPILILVQQPCETEGQMNEIGIDLINVEEHAKRLKELEKELDFIESTEWMYRPIDSAIR